MFRSAVRGSAAILGFVLAAGIAGVGYAQQAPEVGEPVATTLSAPRGLAALPGGDVLLAEAGTGRVLRLKADGTMSEALTGLPVASTQAAGELATRGVTAAVGDGFGGYRYVTGASSASGSSSVYSANAGGVSTLLADLGAFETLNNSDGDETAAGDPELLSNPFDIALDGAGGVFVSDPAADAVIRVDVHGNVRAFFVFPDIVNSRFPFSGASMIDQAPTGIAVGPDGALYVATFTGFPHPQGDAKVYRLKDKNADGDASDEGESSVVATGLTAATDVAFDLDGSMLVTEYSTDMFDGSLGRISRIVDGEPAPLVQLLRGPTSLVVTDDGRLLVTEEPIGRVSDVTNAPTGGFTTPITSGVTLTTYGGASVAQLSAEAEQVGAISVSVSSGGAFIVLVPGAPSFVNSAFNAQYPAGVPAGTVLLVQSK